MIPLRILAVGLLGAGLASASPAPAHELDAKCHEATQADFLARKPPLGTWRDLQPAVEMKGYFSPVIDGCVAVMVDDLRNNLMVFDLHHSFLRDHSTLWNCDRDGVDNVILAKARAFGGRIFSVSYRDYMDDGMGGLPRSVAAPSAPYSRADCRAAMDAKLRELGVDRR